MRLTKHFTLEEFTRSQTATREGIDNTPSTESVQNLIRVAHTLEIVRLELGAPISISSGYRSQELNARIKGSFKSRHMAGLAADFTVQGYTPAEAVAKIRKIVGFNKLILEFNSWVHLDLSSDLKNEVLEAYKSGGKTQYKVI